MHPGWFAGEEEDTEEKWQLKYPVHSFFL